MRVMMSSVWSLAVVAQCSVASIAYMYVYTTGFPELRVHMYKLS